MKQFPDLNHEWFDAEQPQHPVKMTRPFYLAAHQVTVGQFRRFMESSGYKTEAEQGDQGGYAWDGKEWKLDPKKNWKNPGFPQGGNHPVVCVSHNDAVSFLGWLNEQETEKKRRLLLADRGPVGVCVPGRHRGSLRGRRRPGKSGPRRQRCRRLTQESFSNCDLHSGRRWVCLYGTGGLVRAQCLEFVRHDW